MLPSLSPTNGRQICFKYDIIFVLKQMGYKQRQIKMQQGKSFCTEFGEWNVKTSLRLSAILEQELIFEILDTVVKSGTKRLSGKRKVAVKVRKT